MDNIDIAKAEILRVVGADYADYIANTLDGDFAVALHRHLKWLEDAKDRLSEIDDYIMQVEPGKEGAEQIRDQVYQMMRP